MHGRCYRKTHEAYKNYGARGVVVCDRWHVFEHFWNDMGKRPAGMTLDRINNNGPYSPSNCRWVDWRTQNRNRRDVKLYLYKGKMRSTPEIAELLGMERYAFWHRIKHWGIEKAISTPKYKSPSL